MNLITEETTKKELLEEYKNYPTTGGENLLTEKPFYESRLAPLFYEVPMGSKVLDVGANDGTMIEMLQKKRNCEVYGVDISETAIEAAKKRGITVQFADAHKLPFQDKTFDVVILSEVISHVHNPDEVITEIRRVLKKKGFLLGSAPHANLQRYVWEDKRMIRQYYTQDELYQVLSKRFDRCWIKTLTGGQFAISMAEGFLGNEPAEMLFKCGHSDLLNWDAELQDKSVLRCWMGFTQGPGDVYYRMSGYADKMQKLGAQVHYNPYDEKDMNSPSEWCGKIRYIPSERRLTNVHIVNELETLLKASDLSVFQVTSSRDILLVLTTARKGVVKKPMLVECDDWLFDLPSYNLASNVYTPNSEVEHVAYDQFKLSDAIITSTEYLKEKFNKMFPDKPVYVVKNSLDFDIWDNIKIPTTLHDANPELIRIGYTGCGNHSGDLELIKEPVRALLEEYKNLEFIGLPFASTDDIKNERFIRVKQWMPMSVYPQAIANWEMDIGIAPLRDNELNRSKSNLRWLEYSALKVPTIASNIYPFENSIKNGKDGIIVKNSEADWYTAIKGLINAKGKRTDIGKKAYVKVRKDYNMDNVAKSYLSILKAVKNDFIRNMGRVR